MLRKIIDNKWLEARGVIGFYPANTVHYDDIELYTDESKSQAACKLFTLRQQLDRDQDSFVSMADFIAPQESGITDYIGMFAVSAGFRQEEQVARFEQEDDQYSALMIKTLSDRLAEAFAEQLHEQVRTTYWGYSRDERLTPQELLNVKYQGIRPAPGYPSQPDHTEKQTMWEVMKIQEQTGIVLTESLAMNPAASVSGLYFANPNAHYFAVEEICKD